MASDEIVWGIINKQFCAYKLSAPSGQNFCRNEYNVTGLCNRQSCPLANSRYATVRADPIKGTLYLYTKTIERAHLPSKLWSRVKLSQNYATSLSQIDTQLLYWPKFLVHKAKQRLTRLVQVAIRTRRLAREDARLGEKLAPRLAPKVRRREETRERKAEAAAKVERTIERELLNRLREGAYGEMPLNCNETVWRKVLKAMEREGEVVRDRDMDRGVEEEEEEMEGEEELDEAEEEEEEEGNVEYVSDLEESEDDLEDVEDWLESAGEESAEDDDSEDEESEDSEEEEQETKKTKQPSKLAGTKRKKGPAAPRKPKKVIRRGKVMWEKEDATQQVDRVLAI